MFRGFPSRDLPLLTIVLLVLIKAVLLFVLLPYFLDKPTGIYANAFPDQYDYIAETLASGNGYRFSADTAPTLARPPGYVLVLAGIFYVFGKNILFVRIFNLALSILTFGFVLCLTFRLFRSKLVAWAAAVICFLMPGTIIADSRGGVESLQMCLLAATFYLAYVAAESQRFRDYALLGLVFGYAVLVKGSVALMLPAFWLIYWAIYRPQGFFAYTIRCLVSMLVVIIVSAPWVARNYAVSGRFVPMMSVGGMSADQGVYIVKNYSIWHSTRLLMLEAAASELAIANKMGINVKDDDYYLKFYNVDDELRFYDALKSHAIKEYLDNKYLIFKAVVVNLFQFWFSGRYPISTFLNIITTAPILLALAFGVRVAQVQHTRYLPLLAAFLAYIAPHLLIVSMARYYVAASPIFAPFVGAAVVAATRRLRERNPVNAVPPVPQA